MQALVVSAVAVALAEMGDKTQLLSLILAAKYRRPWAIIAGILIATLCNHALAGALGTLVAQWLTPQVLRWITVISFLSVAAWTLVPDKIDEKDAARGTGHSVFSATAISFFIAEMATKRKSQRSRWPPNITRYGRSWPAPRSACSWPTCLWFCWARGSRKKFRCERRVSSPHCLMPAWVCGLPSAADRTSSSQHWKIEIRDRSRCGCAPCACAPASTTLR